MNKRMLTLGAVLVVAAAMAPAWSADRAWHFDTSAIDRSANPGDSFFFYANGNWDRNTPIPADKPALSSFSVLQDRVNEQVRTVVEDAAKAGAPRGSVRQKVGDYFASFMDEAAIEARGLAPLKPDLDAIAAAGGKADLAALFAGAQWNNVPSPVSVGIGTDLRDSSRYMVSLGQGGLGLPSRDFYLDEDNPRFAEIRAKYQDYAAAMLRLAGFPEPEARAKRVFELEKKLARAHWSTVDLRQVEKGYNPMTAAELAAAAPGFDWGAFLKGAGIAGTEKLNIGQPSALAGTAALVASEPLDTWQDYLRLRTIQRYASVLPKAFVETNFDFYGKTLSGTPQLQERWKRAVNSTNGALGEGVGQLYVQRYFPPEAKAKADRLVRNLIAAMDKRLAGLTWMAPETKVKARAKLAAFNPMIGYPDKWTDYTPLQIVRGDAFGNLRRAVRFSYQTEGAKLGKPVDRNEWFMNPQTVNAYAAPELNQIVFPAAHLQPPFFDPDADDAVNYGGIGIGIGHEISHHFDDQGRKFDATGKLSDWWTPADVERFKQLSAPLAAQFSEYEPLPGFKVNGEQTLGENIADLAGLAIAYDAYKIALGGKPAPVIGGFTGDQRFFLGFAQVWRAKYREPLLQQQLKAGVHTPSHLRSNTVRNFDPWYDAFGVKDGALYLPPEKRVRIW
ncbi:MAG TPA: M13 family metallopeptidase [Allosphingosinicella sp.]|jgi:putative endopeptidase|nr:M13 family metallopeptidase [Allosphingosinicella sp.]